MQRLFFKNRDLSLFRSYLLMYACGSILYTSLELLWRGYTHFSMVILGGLCGMIIHHIERRLPDEPLLTRAFLCSLAITGAEFIVGMIVNVWLGLRVWDYSDQPLHIWGQVCVLFSFYWFLLAVPALFVSRFVTEKVTPSLRGSLFFRNTE